MIISSVEGRSMAQWLPWPTIGLFLATFCLYICTLAPTVYNLDSAELTTAAATGGLTRSTGYPLYLILGFFWSRLPVGDVGYRLNLFSAFNGALTIALGERVISRWKISGFSTWVALGALAIAPHFWALSLLAEVYTLHTALMAGLIWLLLRWREQPTPLRLGLVGLILGASFGNHGATVLLLPGVALFISIVAWRQNQWILKNGIYLLVGMTLGASVYLYLPLRYAAHPVFNYAGVFGPDGHFTPVNLHTIQGLWWLVAGKGFSSMMFAYQGTALWKETLHFLLLLSRAFLTAGIGPGLIGIAALFRRDPLASGMLALMFAGHAGFFIDYRAVDKDLMFLPNLLIWAWWAGIGLQALLDWVAASLPPGSFGLRLIQTVAVLGLCAGLVWNGSLVDLSHDTSARKGGEAILAQVQLKATIFGYWETIPVIEYLQLVEGMRPDVKTINCFLVPPGVLNRLLLNEIKTRPLYISFIPSNLSTTIEATPIKNLDLYLLEERLHR